MAHESCKSQIAVLGVGVAACGGLDQLSQTGT